MGENAGTEATDEILRKVSEGYRLLADLHSALTRAPPDAAAAQLHVTNATRELAAIQRIFERRGER